MLRFLWRQVQKHWALHFLIPLLAAVVTDSLVGYWSGVLAGWDRAALILYWKGHILSLLGAYVAFVVVILYFIRDEAAVRITDIGLLDDLWPSRRAFSPLQPSRWTSGSSPVLSCTSLTFLSTALQSIRGF